MALATVGDFIKISMRKLGALQRGDSPSVGELSDFTDTLNSMYREWSSKRFLQGVYNRRVFSWAGAAATRTIGPASDFVLTSRPIKIYNGFFTINQIDYPVEFIAEEKYEGIISKTTQGLPFWLMYLLTSFTQGTLFAYYVPSETMTVTLDTLEPFPEYATFDGTPAIGLPPEYHHAIIYNLCLEIASELGVEPSRQIILMANEALKTIKGLRANPAPRVNVAPELRRTKWKFNIKSGL